MNELSIQVSPEDLQFVEVKWDGEILFRFYKPLFSRELKKLRETSREGVLKTIAEIEQRLVRGEVIRLLARKGCFSNELRKKLISKGFSPLVVEGAIRYSQEKGYIDDGQRIERFIEEEFKKGFGVKGIYFKLKQKKLMSLVTPAIRAWMEEGEIHSLRGYVEKRRVKDKKDKKLITYLMQRGYSYASIQAVLSVTDI